MFRKEIKVVDCTIRDGGLMNAWKFSDEMVKDVYKANVAAGVDYMEIGYKSNLKSFSRKENGDWKFCFEEDMRRIMGENDTHLKISAMADIGRVEDEDILPADESLIDMMRVACYAHQTDKAIDMAHKCMDKGYEVTINLMAVSKVMERDLNEALEDLSKSKVPTIYIVDSFGSLYSEQIQSLAQKYKERLPGKELGYHGHNNMQLAMANTIESVIQGCNYLDGSILGIGRGAGNCPLEILLGFLKNPKYNLKPILQVIQDHLIPLQKDIPWGYHMPYLITGLLNEHPRSSIKWLNGDTPDDAVGFWESMTDTQILE